MISLRRARAISQILVVAFGFSCIAALSGARWYMLLVYAICVALTACVIALAERVAKNRIAAWMVLFGGFILNGAVFDFATAGLLRTREFLDAGVILYAQLLVMQFVAVCGYCVLVKILHGGRVLFPPMNID